MLQQAPRDARARLSIGSVAGRLAARCRHRSSGPPIKTARPCRDRAGKPTVRSSEVQLRLTGEYRPGPSPPPGPAVEDQVAIAAAAVAPAPAAADVPVADALSEGGQRRDRGAVTTRTARSLLQTRAPVAQRRLPPVAHFTFSP